MKPWEEMPSLVMTREQKRAEGALDRRRLLSLSKRVRQAVLFFERGGQCRKDVAAAAQHIEDLANLSST